MNAKRYKVIFSKRRNALMVVGENASSVTKAQGTSEAASANSTMGLQSFVGGLSLVFFAVQCAYANPTGGDFAAGAGAISSAANLTTIHQTSDRAIVNWQSFGSNAGEAIKFVQPSANAAILNRVTGDLPSNLNGALEANGRVYLINPNGIVLGKDGVINVQGGFVASTRDVSNNAFMQGGALVFTGESTGSIQILGKIKSAQGDIILIAPKTEVKAGAELTAGQTIKLVAANEVELSDGKITVKPKTSDAGEISVEGALQAAQVQLEAHNNNLGALAINTTGTIRATGTQTNPDGSVSIMAYGEGSNIKVSGNISAQNNDPSKQGGRIIVGRNEETGILAKSADVSGATFTTNKGFVETSGRQLAVDGAQVIAKDWLLDPSDITINDSGTETGWTNTSGSITPNTSVATSFIKTSTISDQLERGTNVTITTTNNGTSGSGQGNIGVSGTINKAASRDAGGTILANGATNNATLSLIADNGITVDGTIKSTSGQLNINLTAKGMTNGKPAGAMTATERALSRGLFINGAALNANGGNITLTGTSYADTYVTRDNQGVCTAGNCNAAVTNAIGKGVQIHNGASLSANNINITGVAEGTRTQTGVDANNNPVYYYSSGYGVVIQRFPSVAIFNATGNISITGTVQGAGNGSGLSFAESGWGAQAPSLTATGNITLRGNNRASTSNTSEAIRITSGVQAIAGGNIVLQAETNNNAVNAINAYSTNVAAWGSALYGNMTLQATGDVLIQANQGGVALNNQLPNTLVNGALTSENKITGRNITIDNTGAGMAVGAGIAVTGSGGTQGASIANGGSISTSGAITAGTGKATGGNGINLADNRTITATGNFNLYGASNANAWAVISAAKVTAANFSVQGYNSNPNGTVSGGGLQLNTGASFTGTATSGSNLIKGTWGASQFGSTYGLLVGDSSSSNISLTSAAGSTLSIEGYNNMTSVLAGNMYYSPGLHTQGVVNTSGTLTLKGYSQVHHGLAINGTLTHTGGALTLDGTSQPFSGYPASGGSSAGVQLNGILNVNGGNNLTVTGTNKTTNSSNQSGSTAFGVNTASGSQLNGSGGTLSITGLTPMNSGLTAANLPKTRAIYSAGSISGWGDTTLLGQNLASSSLPTVQVVGNIDVELNKLNILANGGQISQGTNSILTAGRVTIDNTGAGRSSLMSDNSVTGVNLTGPDGGTAGTAFNGSIDAATGAITVGSASSVSQAKGVDLNGVINTTGNINIAGQSTYAASPNGVNLNTTTLTATGGDIKVQSNTALTVLKAMTATKPASTGGNITLTSTGGDIIQQADINAAAIATLDNSTATGRSIIRTAGIISGDTVNLKAANQIGAEDVASPAATNRIQVSANKLSMSSAGHQYVTGIQSMVVGATSTGGGDVNVKTTNGMLTVGSVNRVVGISTANSGNISLVGNNLGTTGDGIRIAEDITAAGGTVTLTGTTAAATPAVNNGTQPPPYAGIYNSKTVTGKEIVLTAKATNASSNALGYYGAGGNLTATNTLRAAGSTASSNQPNSNGFYMWGGATTAGGTLTIEGSSNTSAVALDNTATVKSTSGSVSIIATNGDIKSGGGSNVVEAKGDVLIKAGTDQNSSGKIDGATLTVTQVAGSTGSTIVQTTGKGSVTAPKVINKGTGNVIVAAGSSIAAGDGSGGQVLTVANNTIAQNSTGKTYIYTGSTTGTGALVNLDSSGFSELRLSGDMKDSNGTTLAQNADSNVGYLTNNAPSTITNGAKVQVLFREELSSLGSGKLTGTDLTHTYGDVNTNSAQTAALVTEMRAALKTANSTNGVGNVVSQNATAGTLKISSAALIDELGVGTLNSPGYSTSQYLKANTAGYSYATTAGTKYGASLGSGQAAKVEVNQKVISVSGITAADKMYDGNTSATIDKANAVFNGKVGNDDLTVDVVSGAFSDKNVARDSSYQVVSKTVTLNPANYGGSDVGNYDIQSQTNTTAKITQNNVARVKFAASSDSKTYNGAEQTMTGFSSVSGLLGDDVANNGGMNAETKGKTVGNYNNTQFIGLADLLNNYGSVETHVGTLTINAADLTVTATQVAKTYDGTTRAAGVGQVGALAGANNGETVSNTGMQAFTDKNFGIGNKTVKASGVTIKDAVGSDVTSNYNIQYVDNTTSTINKAPVYVTAKGDTVFYNGTKQTDTITNSGWLSGDKVAIVGAGSGTQVGSYRSNLALTGADAGNYQIVKTDATFTIQENVYNHSSADAVSLTPVSFGFAAMGGATAAGGEVEGSCDAWSQRVGAGSVAEVTLLKPNYMGLRNAKTDSMDAMAGSRASGASADAGDSPCGSAALKDRQASL